MRFDRFTGVDAMKILAKTAFTVISTLYCRRFLAICMLIALWGCATDPKKLSINLPPPPLPEIQQTEPLRDGRTLYVDQQISRDSCTDYSPGDRACGKGSDEAYRRLSDACSAVEPGGTVVLRAGNYNEPLSPVRSGSAKAPIAFKNLQGEKVIITGIDNPAVYFRNVSHIVVEGITVSDAVGWARLENAHFNMFKNNQFINALARGTTGGFKIVKSHYNQVADNHFESGNDSIVIQESDRNLIAGNTFRWARHSLVSVRCGNFNVVRENEFHNERQKSMEIYDCEAVSDAPFKLDATKRNLVEYNRFIYTRGPSEPHKYNAIQFSGQYGIVRRNLFYDNQGGGVNFQVYSAEALHNYGNRVYHNTFYKNRCYAVSASRSMGEIFGDNLVTNNLFWGNEDCNGYPDQIGVGNSDAVILQHNAIMKPNDDPQFVSEGVRDLRLKSESPLVDSGVFLTRTVGNGRGTSMPVEDVRYFSDGFGIQGLKGDLIQLERSRERARIAAVDYVQGVLFLDKELSWAGAQGVALAFEGKAPDMGAYEYEDP